MVALMNKSGGAAAFGEWAGRRIKSKVGVQLATVILGILIFAMIISTASRWVL
jgi:hypothetical protein